MSFLDEIHTVPANKTVLAALSPVFDTMFFGSLPEKGDVPVDDADADVSKEFLQLFYLGEVTLTMENIETVVCLVDKYDVLKHVNACAVFLKGQLTLDNICWGYQLTVNLENDELMKYCEDKITKSPKDIFATDAFKRCDKGVLQRILELCLMCKETDVFDACLTWARYACEQDDLDTTQAVNLRTQLGDCFKLFRFSLMKSEEFSERYMLNKGLFTSEEFEDVMLSLSAKGYKAKIFNQSPRYYPWDVDNILRCQRKTSGPEPKKYIQLQEVTSFSSNKHLLLGEIQTSVTWYGSSKIAGNKVDVTITEREKMDQLKVTLPQPILIKPKRMYEVCLEV
ncbi:BTB/POZ domain-containing protein 3-like [Sitodiplosis mosellana]|uniref:BTB/POZ domain-containing protein 3-like n=1 Tax=Sitodiplosis mosellana TaxID=263140 RepID=UPI00244419EB|nr:BTB/POZ domain-containing protein 3-like [Sitodiplosis mosellana]